VPCTTLLIHQDEGAEDMTKAIFIWDPFQNPSILFLGEPQSKSRNNSNCIHHLRQPRHRHETWPCSRPNHLPKSLRWMAPSNVNRESQHCSSKPAESTSIRMANGIINPSQILKRTTTELMPMLIFTGPCTKGYSRGKKWRLLGI
jgi:hypothetical protein